ncbi:MAG: extracellular solute-binding protein [Plesiomonas sp.]
MINKGWVFGLMIGASVGFSAQAVAKEKLYVYNWTDYIPAALLEQFTKETGIDVIYSTFESNEEMYSKLKLTQGAGYDLVVPSTYYISKMAREGMLQTLDHRQLKNFANLDPSLLSQEFDPKNQFSVPYVWGATGIAVNRAEIDPTTVNSWQDLWKPAFKDHLLLTNDSREVFHMALLVKGFSPNTTNPDEISQAYEFLRPLMPNVRVFNSDAPDVPYLQDEVSVGMIWNGPAWRAAQENPDIQFIYPKEGAIFWMDSMAIPAPAQNPQAAYRFIDFLLRPESAVAIIKELGYSVPNRAAIPLLDKAMAENTTLFPPAAAMQKGQFQRDVGDAITLYETYWNQLRSGK